MKKVELKKKGSLTGRLFRRLLRTSWGFQESISLQQRYTHADVFKSSYHNYHEVVKVVSEAERKKAEALIHARALGF